MEQWLLPLGALLVGGVIGAIITIVNMRRGRGDEESIRSLRREFDHYQDEVTQHFVETAALVNNLTQSYKAVYDHLEQGAYQLVGEETLHKKLEGVHAEPVMLEYIGQRRALDVNAEPAVAAAPAAATIAPKAAGGASSSEVASSNEEVASANEEDTGADDATGEGVSVAPPDAHADAPTTASVDGAVEPATDTMADEPPPPTDTPPNASGGRRFDI